MAKGTTFGYQNYTSSIDNRSGLERFEAIGHPGKYYSSYHYDSNTSAQADFTGSNYGFNSIMVVSAGVGLTGSLSGGGTVALGALTAKTIYELSISKITGSGEAYLFNSAL